MSYTLPLHLWHEQNGARFINEGGVPVPNDFGRIAQEYAALRQGTALLDFCHEARFRIEGSDGQEFLNRLITADLEKIEVGHLACGVLCNDRGGIIDLFRIYHSESYWLLMGSSVSRKRVFNWLQARSREMSGASITVSDITESQGHLSIIGAVAESTMSRAAFNQDLALDRGESAMMTVGTARALVIRRDYNSTDGYDLISGSIYIQAIWERLIEIARPAGIMPVGLAAQEIHRIEEGIPKVGRDIDEETIPMEVRMSDRVELRKKAFIGRRALLHSSTAELSRVMVLLRFDSRATVQPGAEVQADRIPVGVVTSVSKGMMVPGRLALAMVNSLRADVGSHLMVLNPDGTVSQAEIIRPPSEQQKKF
jgi:glycine cleavage system T protein (aminomethyltransferase)